MKASEWVVSVQRKGRKPDDRDIVFTGSFDSAAAYVHAHTCSASLTNVHACMRSGSFTASGPNGTMFHVKRSKGCLARDDFADDALWTMLHKRGWEAHEALEREIEQLMEEGDDD